MEPFSITCHSCAARLKVATAELIDQTLACPKCGSMIHVQHPTGWKPPIPESKGSQSALSSVVSGNDFDHIEDLLANPGKPIGQVKTGAGSADRKSHANAKSPKARFQKPTPPTDAVVHPNGSPNQPGDPSAKDQPILPGQQWANPTAQKRKKLMLMIISAIATVLVVSLAIVAIVRFSAETPSDDLGQVAVADNQDDAQNNVKDADPDSTPGDPSAKPNAPADDSNNFLDESPTVGSQPIIQGGTSEEVRPIVPALNTTGFEPPTLVPVNPSPKIGPPPVDDRSLAGAPDKPPAETKSLTKILAEAGIRVSELQDTALLLRSFEEAQNPKFVMEKPKTKNLKFERLLSLPIRKLETPDGISLARAARMLNLLSGVPIAVDTRQLSLMGLPTNPTLKLSLEDETTLSAATKIADLAGAKATVVGDGILISLPAAEKNADFEIAFPNVGGLNDDEKQRFVLSIQALVDPDVWTRPTTPAKISYQGETIVLDASVGVQRHIQMLVDRMNAAAELAANSENEKAATIVMSRWSASEGLRTEPTEWSVGPDLTIASFLDRIERLHGLTVTIDWPTALAAGWTPLTLVPGELVEAEVGEAVHELAKSMNLRVIGIDAKTLQLTSANVANGVQDLEVYPLLADWAGETAPSEIEQLVFNVLGQQVKANFVRIVYEPKCRCLIVVASQPIQRQVAKLVERLNRVNVADPVDR